MSQAPRLSVVIPTYQRCAPLRRLLQALSLQTLPLEQFEVVVAIDGSTDGTREMLSNLEPPYRLRVLWQPNGGRAAACNTGIRASRGEIVVLLDDDMEPEPDLLAAHWRAHLTRARAGVLGAVPVRVDTASPPVVRFVARKFDNHLAALADAGHAIDIRDFYSGNFSIRRELLLEVGGFDESFRIYGNEDGELAARLLGARVELVYDPAAAATQHYEKDFAALARDNIAKGRTAVLCARKHPKAVTRLRLGTLHMASTRWRLLRGVLLAASERSERVLQLVLRLVGWVERGRPDAVLRLYTPALDLCFWFGAQAALREQRGGRLEDWIDGSAASGALT